MKYEELLSQEERNELKNITIEKKRQKKHMVRSFSQSQSLRIDDVALYYIYHFTCFLSYYKFNSLFILLGFFIVCQIYFILRLWLYHKHF